MLVSLIWASVVVNSLGVTADKRSCMDLGTLRLCFCQCYVDGSVYRFQRLFCYHYPIISNVCDTRSNRKHLLKIFWTDYYELFDMIKSCWNPTFNVMSDFLVNLKCVGCYF